MLPKIFTRTFLGIALALTISTLPSAEAQTTCTKDADCAKNEFCEFAAGTCPKPNTGSGTCVLVRFPVVAHETGVAATEKVQ